MNSLFAIQPYKTMGLWVFDDVARGLTMEPFVGGADQLIDLATQGLNNPESGFVMVFSAGAFPGGSIELTWRRAETSGNVYYCEQLDQEGWLCPALLKYFPEPPPKLYVRISAL